MRVEELVSPRNKAEIFEDDADALFRKPYMTGDVFTGVPDPDASASDGPARTMTVSIVAHPCAIRGAGGQLKTRVPCCLVSQINHAVPYLEWPDGHFDYFPLDDALGLGERQVVRLMEFRPVHRRELTRERRAVGLTPRGVYVFQQRFTHALTRVAFPLEAFEEGSKHIVDEAELETEWVEHFAAHERDEREIKEYVKAFHNFLDKDVGGVPLRNAFKQPGGTSAVTKAVRGEMARLSAERS